METILITGGTGLVGMQLSELLSQNNYKVIHLSRKAKPTAKFPAYRWNLQENFLDPLAIQEADHIIHLAGANVAGGLWTKSYRKELMDSRVLSTRLLHQALAKRDTPIKSFLGASAIGIYGDTGDTLLHETAPAGKGFLADICIAWEKETEAIKALGIPCKTLRIGIVLAKEGGALNKIKTSFNLKMGGYFGNGKMYMSWIHIHDLCALFLHTIQSDIEGAYNAVSPNPVSNKDFTKTLSKVLGGGNLILPVPAFALKLAMGEMSRILLNSNKVSSEKTEATGFEFQYPTLEDALQNLMAK